MEKFQEAFEKKGKMQELKVFQALPFSGSLLVLSDRTAGRMTDNDSWAIGHNSLIPTERQFG